MTTVIAGGSGEGCEVTIAAERVPFLDAFAAVGARLRRAHTLVVCMQQCTTLRAPADEFVLKIVSLYCINNDDDRVC